MIFTITIADEEGIVKGQYKVTTDVPDTTEEMEELDRNFIHCSDCIGEVIERDLTIWGQGGV